MTTDDYICFILYHLLLMNPSSKQDKHLKKWFVYRKGVLVPIMSTTSHV
jgi:cytosine/uracil/thiamine/allantoin permease